MTTFTTPGAYCLTRWWKEVQDGFYRACQPPSGQKLFTALSLQISNNYAKKRGIRKKLILTIRAVMLDDEVDLVAGNFNGAAWRRVDSNNTSIIEEALADCALPRPPGPTLLWRPGAIPGKWADVCGFDTPPDSDRTMESSSARRILHFSMKLLVPTDQSCHHEAWLHLDSVEWRSAQSHREKHDRRILLKERSAPYHYGKQKGHISDVTSDHSLSSK